jgi:hypothetical protein
MLMQIGKKHQGREQCKVILMGRTALPPIDYPGHLLAGAVGFGADHEDEIAFADGRGWCSQGLAC